MIKKKELLAYPNLKYELRWLSEQYMTVKSMKGLKGSNISGSVSSSHSNNDKIGTLIVSESELKRKIQRLQFRISSIEYKVKRIPDPIARKGIILRYLKEQPWAVIVSALNTKRSTIRSRMNKFIETN